MEKYMWRPVSYKQNTSPTQKPCARWGHSCCTVGTDVVLFGGYAESVYMNDLWVFDTITMKWSEIKTQGSIPLPRSNATASYDSKNNRIVFFGGGGSNKVRYNSINVLDWQTKTWSELPYKQNQTLPWQRTYHTAQLLYPYLIVHGGQGIADLDDLWAYNFETGLWKQIKTPKQQIRPCGRRFHSSCLIGNQFYVIAGCHTKYRCLNDIFSIDLTNLLETGGTEGLTWRERSTKGTALLSRWGHSSASFDNKIYIFGGRFSTDLNDLLIFDPIKQTLRILKVSPDSLPKPRRRPSTCFVGSCLLMFGGFNSDYYNDLHFINVGESFVKPKNYKPELSKKQKIQHITNLFKVSANKDYDYYLQSSDKGLVPCFKDLLVSSEEEWQKIEDFLIAIDGHYSYQKLTKIVQSLYLGYCGIENFQFFQQHNINMAIDQQQKTRATRRSIEQKLLISGSFSCIIKNKLTNGIIELDDQKFGEMIQKNRESIKKNITFVINNSFVLESNKNLLSLNNKFFRSILNNYKENQKNQEFINLSMPSNNIVLFEILLNSILFGILTVPTDMSYESWIQLYVLADYFCMPELRQVCTYQISIRLDEKSFQSIYSFAKSEEVDDLGLACAKYRINNLKFMSEMTLKQPYLNKVYNLNRFQILQKNKLELQPKFHKHKSELTQGSEGEKQNYQVCN